MISHLLNSLLIGILYADLLERRFPDQFRAILTDLTFNALYLFSKAQIYFVRLNRNFNEYVESNPTLSKIKKELDFLIKSNTATIFSQPFSGKNYDLILISWYDNETKMNNRKIVYDKNEKISIGEHSDIRFILVELKIGDKTHKIDLKTDKFNFYIVGNKFTKQFFIFYLSFGLKINEPINDADKLSLKIIDHNVNTLEIDFTDKNDSIVLEKNGYKIVNNDE
jgi:hypothetical protein